MTQETFSYKVIKNKMETHNVILLQLQPFKGQVFHFLPGQFVMLVLYDTGGKEWQARPFSIASSPTNSKYLELGIKIYGEYTHKAAELKVGEKVGIRGPFGGFVFDENKMKNIVMLAGG